jgi:N4-gp56 family major capsid protein
MTATTVPFGDARAIKRWSSLLASDMLSKQYFSKKFIGTDDNSIIQQKTELQSDAGDDIQFDLSVQLKGTPTSGDNRLKGREENLRFYSDEVRIDQLRHSVSAGGRMTRKRTAHDLRKLARDKLGDYWSEYIDQVTFVYLSGARGINQDFYEPITYTGFANNPVQAPDTAHLMYGGAATSKASMVAGDLMSRDLVVKVNVNVGMIRALDPTASNLEPVTMDGETRYILLMSLFQEYSMKTATGATGWLEIQKAAAAANGDNDKMFKGSLGMIGGVILHSHKSVIRFSDYGAGANLPASRALFMGRQAGIIAYGTPNGTRMMWEEELEDYGNEPTVAAGMIVGIKKTRYNGKDFGLVAVDTSSPTP